MKFCFILHSCVLNLLLLFVFIFQRIFCYCFSVLINLLLSIDECKQNKISFSNYKSNRLLKYATLNARNKQANVNNTKQLSFVVFLLLFCPLKPAYTVNTAELLKSFTSLFSCSTFAPQLNLNHKYCLVIVISPAAHY